MPPTTTAPVEGVCLGRAVVCGWNKARVERMRYKCGLLQKHRITIVSIGRAGMLLYDIEFDLERNTSSVGVQE